ncbi:MAG: MFS transporter [Clostridia bacterium]|nr:MFS transporter [Clostridia bacterium]
MEVDFSSAEYKRSRNGYIFVCMFEYFVTLMVADAFLAKLLKSVGFKDGDIGIISSFISLAFVFQLFSLLLAGKRGSKRKMILILDTVGQMLFFALYLLPFINIDATLRRVLVYVFIIGAYMSKYLVSTFLFQWANSYVDPKKRASYSGLKEIVSLVGGIIFTLVMGAVFDWFEANGNLSGGFLFLAISILISNLCLFISLLLIKKDEPKQEATQKKTFSDIISHTLGNKNMRRLIIISVLWKSARYFTIGFMGTFKTDAVGNGLGLTVLAVQIITMVGDLVRIAVTKPLAKYSDKRSFASGFYLSMFIAIAAFLCIVFTTEQTWFLIVGYTVLLAVSAAGSDQNAFNMTYSYVDSNYIAEAMALQNCISGVCGFLCSLVAGKILDAIQAAGNTLFGIPMFGQQFLSLISVVLCVICIVFMRMTILKEKVMKQ